MKKKALDKPASQKKKRVVMSRKVRRDEQDRSFDLEFWQKVDANSRFAAAWQMVLEIDRIRGKHAKQPRLQRSVSVLKRRRR